jgi:hypothetical protein
MRLDDAFPALRRKQLELFGHFDETFLPEEIFHYTTASGLIGILSSHPPGALAGVGIWASDSFCLNDT